MRKLTLRARWFLMATAALFLAEQPMRAYAGGDDCAQYCAQAKAGAYKDGHVSSQSQVDGNTFTGSQMKWGFVLDICGPPPSHAASAPGGAMSAGSTTPQATSSSAPPPRSGDPVPPSFHSGDTDWDNCFSLLTAEWAQVAPDCAAIDACNDSYTYDMTAAIIYTVAAATCYIACIAGKTGFGSFMEGVCAVAGVAGMITDIIGQNKLDDAGVKNNDGLAALGQFGAAAGALTAAVGTFANTSTNTSTSASRKISCAAGAIFTIVAVMKYAALPSFGNTADDACRDIKKLGDNPFSAAYNAHGGITAPSGSQGSSSALGAGGSGGNLKGKATGTGTPGVLSFFQGDVDLTHFPPPGGLAATADVGNPALRLFQNMPELQHKLPEALQAMGTDFKDFAKKVADSGPVGAMGSLSGMPEDALSMAKAAEAATNDELKKHPDLVAPPSSVMASGGGGGGGAKKAEAKKSPFGDLFGAKAPGAGGAPNAAEFEKQKKKDVTEAEGGDIWHEGFAGSIFQIVSKRLDRTSSRVEQLEWVTPLNRALAGLPSNKAAKPSQVSNTTHGGGK